VLVITSTHHATPTKAERDGRGPNWSLRAAGDNANLDQLAAKIVAAVEASSG